MSCDRHRYFIRMWHLNLSFAAGFRTCPTLASHWPERNNVFFQNLGYQEQNTSFQHLQCFRLMHKIYVVLFMLEKQSDYIVDNRCLLCIDLCLGCYFYFNHPLGFFVHGLCFSNNRLNRLPLTSYLHAIMKIISRGVSGLATDFPCGVWSCGWTTCLLHDSPLFDPHFKMTVGM